MSPVVRDVLAAFDALSPEEQEQVATEILRRLSGSDDVPEAALHELADELFCGYDAEEACACPSLLIQGRVPISVSACGCLSLLLSKLYRGSSPLSRVPHPSATPGACRKARMPVTGFQDDWNDSGLAVFVALHGPLHLHVVAVPRCYKVSADE